MSAVPQPWQIREVEGPDGTTAWQAPDGTLWASPEALYAELYRRPYREAEEAAIEAAEIAEHGDEPRKCAYCGMTTRTVREWVSGAECTWCHGAWDRQPPPWATGEEEPPPWAVADSEPDPADDPEDPIGAPPSGDPSYRLPPVPPGADPRNLPGWDPRSQR